MDQISGDDSTDRPPSTPEQEAAALALAIVSQASAITQGDEEALDASEDNLREVVTGLSDAPLTPRQEDVVATLGAAGGSLAAGLSEALAHTKGVDTGVVLGSAAEAVLAQTQPEAENAPDAASASDAGTASDDGAGAGDATAPGADDRSPGSDAIADRDNAAFDDAFDDLVAGTSRDDAGQRGQGARRDDRHADGRRPDDDHRAS
ncbi:hypothetical protein [Frigoribacterium sp. CFBP 13712]|uniref:hypothetical protein n=1 Tax=Frigoribacterium sp. CFBP 13712 TaxID=2775309 RepID=UPI00177A9B12|nr:hypothetical protein [Frigoribacterium sp. CFBP 13712]MBD8703673.1 hypothetical protein [Frigoribacterium sp. CFBP 13712]